MYVRNGKRYMACGMGTRHNCAMCALKDPEGNCELLCENYQCDYFKEYRR